MPRRPRADASTRMARGLDSLHSRAIARARSAFAAVTSAIVLLLAVATTATAAPGDLDTANFKNPNGWTALPGPSGTVMIKSRAVAVQSTGRIITVGTHDAGSGDRGIAFAQQDDGLIDTGFGSGADGYEVAPASILEWNDVVLDASDRIYLVGTTVTGPNIAVQRLNPDGSTDLSWNAGAPKVLLLGVNASARAAALDPSNGQLVVAGSTTLGDGVVARVAAGGGGLDSGFNTTGYRTFTPPGAFGTDVEDIAIDSSGIYVAGTLFDPQLQAFVMRTSPSGGATPSYFTTSGGFQHEGLALWLDPRGLYLAGRAFDGGSTDAFVAWRFAHGTLGIHPNWNGGSPLLVDVSAGQDAATGILVEPDGKVVLSGTADELGNPRAAATRITSDGLGIDVGFNSGTPSVLDITPGDDVIEAATADNAGRLVVAGVGGFSALVARYELGNVVTANTTLNMSGCEPGTSGITSFGSILLGSPATTVGDCLIQFGSSTHTSMLRVAQADGIGDAMVSTGGVGASFGDFSPGINDWMSSTSMFGACLSSVGGTAMVDLSTWQEDWSGTVGDCAPDNTDPWQAIPATTSDAGSTIAKTSTASSTGSVALRFGARADIAQPAGTYRADLVFEVVAPAV